MNSSTSSFIKFLKNPLKLNRKKEKDSPAVVVAAVAIVVAVVTAAVVLVVAVVIAVVVLINYQLGLRNIL